MAAAGAGRHRWARSIRCHRHAAPAPHQSTRTRLDLSALGGLARGSRARPRGYGRRCRRRARCFQGRGAPRRHGAHARWRAARDRCLLARSRWARAGNPRAHPLWQISTRRAAREHRRRRDAREPRLRGRVSGLPRSRALRRSLRQVFERRTRRLRLLRVADRASLEQRAHRHDGAFLRRTHAERARQRRGAGREGDVHGFRRLFKCLSGRHPPRRRLRIEAGDLGIQRGARGAGNQARPGAAGGAARAGFAAVVSSHAVAARPLAAQPRAGVRRLCLRPMGAWRLRRLLASARLVRKGILRSVLRCGDVSDLLLV